MAAEWAKCCLQKLHTVARATAAAKQETRPSAARRRDRSEEAVMAARHSVGRARGTAVIVIIIFVIIAVAAAAAAAESRNLYKSATSWERRLF